MSPNGVIDTLAVAGGAAGKGDAAGAGAGLDTLDGTVDGARPAEEPQPAINATATGYAPGNRISRMVTLTWRKPEYLEGMGAVGVDSTALTGQS
jgi:hypothetical protein